MMLQLYRRLATLPRGEFPHKPGGGRCRPAPAGQRGIVRGDRGWPDDNRAVFHKALTLDAGQGKNSFRGLAEDNVFDCVPRIRGLEELL